MSDLEEGMNDGGATGGRGLGIFALTHRVAVVTGAAGGLGREIARGLAEAGATVAVTDADERGAQTVVDELSAAGLSVTCAPLDVTNRSEIERVVDEVCAAHGRIDVWVNCAGGGTWCPATEIAPEQWDHLLALNLTGAFHCCQEVGRRMLAQGSGNIINVVSQLGIAGRADIAGYAASKGGLVQLTRALAVEWATKGIRVNAIAPSSYETPALVHNRKRRPELYGGLLERIPMHRYGKPHELIGPAVFLASDASSMVTGHVLAADGGYLAA